MKEVPSERKLGPHCLDHWQDQREVRLRLPPVLCTSLLLLLQSCKTINVWISWKVWRPSPHP